jgi:acetolactate synthase-1/2/3 large subunit
MSDSILQTVNDMGVSAPMCTGADLTCAALQALEVDTVFGMVSIHNVSILDAIRRSGKIRFVTTRHEQAAVHAADGYARATGRLGVALASTGPGTANAVPGLFEAMSASSPVLLVTTQVESALYGSGAEHEALHQVAMLRSVTRRVESARHTDDIVPMILRCAADALTGRPAPAAVEVPVDLQDSVVPSSPVIPPIMRRIEPALQAVSMAADLIRSTSKRLVIAGGGIASSDAATELVQLAEMLDSPVVTSRSGRGAIPDGHALAVGPWSAMGGYPKLLAEADLVIAVGTRFQAHDTHKTRLPIHGHLVHIDIDPSVIGRSYATAATVVGDAKLALRELCSLLPDAAGDPEFAARARQARDKRTDQLRSRLAPGHSSILRAIGERTPADAPIVLDTTMSAFMWGHALIPAASPRRIMYPHSFGIGPALPLAMGAAIGLDRPTLVLCGDGGLMLHISELATLAEQSAPVVVCVFNDRGYGTLREVQRLRYEDTFGVDLQTPDFVAVAKAMGIRGHLVGKPDQFDDLLGQALTTPGPDLIEIDATNLAPIDLRPRGDAPSH